MFYTWWSFNYSKRVLSLPRWINWNNFNSSCTHYHHTVSLVRYFVWLLNFCLQSHQNAVKYKWLHQIEIQNVKNMSLCFVLYPIHRYTNCNRKWQNSMQFILIKLKSNSFFFLFSIAFFDLVLLLFDDLQFYRIELLLHIIWMDFMESMHVPIIIKASNGMQKKIFKQ